MWTYEVLPLRGDIANYFVPMWHVGSNKFQFALVIFIALLLDLVCWRFYWCGSPQMCPSIYSLGNRLLQDYPFVFFACLLDLLKLPRILFYEWCLTPIFFNMFFRCEGDLEYIFKLPTENNSKYYLSLDNWYSFMR
jgi:hypothetical protein